MKKTAAIILCTVMLCLLSGCKSEWTVGIDISSYDITDFYYTYENINFNAFYQRYRFYVENGKQFFSYETRERKGEYGPATEKDVTRKGTIELSSEEWERFFDHIKGGTVVPRKESVESGGRGPWLYLYWVNDKSRNQVFSFASAGDLAVFEEYCSGLAEGK